jgi:hypothetical protein
MGATLWEHATRWQPDANDALLELQAQFLAANYDLSKAIPEHLASSRQALADAEAEGDPYGIADVYREDVELLEGLAQQPIPDDPQQQIQILRRIWASGGQGIGNVLDVKAVGNRRHPLLADVLAEEDIARFAGTARPTLDQAQAAIYAINEELHRGECVCFPFYDETDEKKPAGWYFVGNTID